MIYNKIMQLHYSTAQGLLLQVHLQQTPPRLPLDLREILGLKDAPSLQCLRDLPTEEESLFGEVDQDVADNFTQVHTTDHLLKPKTGGTG